MFSFDVLLVLNLLLIFTNAVRYEIEYRDETLFVPCDDQPEIPLEKVFDVSNLKFENLEDGTFHVFGSAEVVYDIKPDTKLQFNLISYKKSRDNWVSTIYNMKRNDLCKAATDPLEPWYNFFGSIPEEQRICPLYKGQKFDFNATSKSDLNVPDPRLDGDYKGTITIVIEDDGPKTIVCANVFGSVYRA